jgi:hypothetical protein
VTETSCNEDKVAVGRESTVDHRRLTASLQLIEFTNVFSRKHSEAVYACLALVDDNCLLSQILTRTFLAPISRSAMSLVVECLPI